MGFRWSNCGTRPPRRAQQLTDRKRLVRPARLCTTSSITWKVHKYCFLAYKWRVLHIGWVLACRSHFSLWCIMASPLLLGNDPRSMSQDTLATLLAPEVIAVNQDPLVKQGRKVSPTPFWCNNILVESWGCEAHIDPVVPFHHKLCWFPLA